MKEGRCLGCGQIKMVNRSSYGRNRLNLPAGDYCADCWEKYDLPTNSNPGTHSVASGEPSPSWDNVVRALEEFADVMPHL